jgi:predicted Zn-dependent protease
VILTFLKELRAEYGSVEAYLRSHGLTDAQIASLRALYLE